MMALTQENVHYTLNSGPGVLNKSNRVHARIQEFSSGGGGGGGRGPQSGQCFFSHQLILQRRSNGFITEGRRGSNLSKNVSCGSFYNMKAEKFTTLIHESSVFHAVVHNSYLEVAIFIFSFHSKSMSVRVRLTCRTECTYMYCLVYFYAAFSRVLRHHDQKRKLRYTLLCYVVELAVSSEQKLYFCYDSSDPVGPNMIPLKTIVIEQVRGDISSVK